LVLFFKKEHFPSASVNPTFWQALRLLLSAAHRRAIGRRRRQRELFRQRAARKTDFGQLGFVLAAVFLALVHVAAAFMVAGAVSAGQRVAAEQQGWIVADPWFIAAAAHPETLHHRRGPFDAVRAMDHAYAREAAAIAQRDGGDPRTIEQRLRQTVAENGSSRLMPRGTLAWDLSALPRAGNLAAMLGSLALLIWFAMMICQGEGLELDIQRRRHPMWEFLFSHPVPPGAVFLAEMLSPLAANPIYFSAPLFPGLLYGFAYGLPAGLLAGVIVGIPVTVAAACLGKSLEVAVTLRVAPRSRGAMIGIMGWLGYVTMIGIVLAAVSLGRVFAAMAGPLGFLAVLPFPYLGWFLGVLPGGQVSLAAGLTVDLLLSVIIIAGSVKFAEWGAGRGLTGNPGPATSASAVRKSAGFGGDALYRKEILWFLRDRSALVQAVLVPLSLAGYQAFNLRGILMRAGHQWNALCGAAVVFGTYFLLVLGPKSLASEGAALWISLTWPHGLEKLLRAKARLWTLLASVIVGIVMLYAAIRFPADSWRVALIAIAWFLFARSMAAKTVTLATVTSESGEIQKVPMGRRLAAQLGLLTFSIGVISRQWNLVIIGVIYSSVTAAAMWQNFRARLPYLYDPWSEVLPKPPTLMHAMIGISVLVELGAVITGGLLVFFSRDQVAIAHAAIYGLCAATISICMAWFLRRRQVWQADIWNWRDDDATPVWSRPAWWDIARPGRLPLPAAMAVGAALGITIGGVGLGYVALVKTLPDVANQVQQGLDLMKSVPHLRQSLFVMAVLIAPFAEEFLFRGLLYRALDREWGGWRAVLGSAAFFAAYHPLLSWAPVFLVGAVNAVLFKKTGRLAPAVVVHMVYNAIVLA
jgi:membrane protease YdiL (CAAX protease family)